MQPGRIMLCGLLSADCPEFGLMQREWGHAAMVRSEASVNSLPNLPPLTPRLWAGHKAYGLRWFEGILCFQSFWGGFPFHLPTSWDHVLRPNSQLVLTSLGNFLLWDHQGYIFKDFGRPFFNVEFKIFLKISLDGCWLHL